MILAGSILLAVSGFSQTREDGHRVLKENGLEHVPAELRMLGGLEIEKKIEEYQKAGKKDSAEYTRNMWDTKAAGIGRCGEIFNTPNGVYITTMEWIGNTKRIRPVIYLYVEYNTNFDNGKLSKIESLQGFFAYDYSEKFNMLLIAKFISSLVGDDNLSDPIFNIGVYTYDLTSKTKKLQVTGNSSINSFKFSTNGDSIKYSAQQKNVGGVGSRYITKSIKMK